MSRPKVLVVTSSFPMSDDDSRNAGVFVVDLAELLVDHGCDVIVTSPQRSTVTGRFAVRSFPRLGDEPSLSHLNPRTPSGLLKLLSVLVGGVVSVPSIARKERVDHVLALWAVPSGALALVTWWLTRTPYSVWALGSDIWRIRDYPGGRALLRLVLRRATRRYADGVQLAEDTAAIAGLPCAFLATSRVLDRGQDRCWDDDAVHVVTIARFHEHKGVDVLLEAIARVPDQLRGRLRVHVYGDGPMRDELAARATRPDLAGIVVLEGLADAEMVADALASADLAVIPSRLESIPLVLSDICRAGTPLVATDAGDMGELVARFDAGAVVPAGDAAALAEAITRAVDGPAVEGPVVDGPAPGGTPTAGSAAGRAALAEHLSLERSVVRFLGDVGLDDVGLGDVGLGDVGLGDVGLGDVGPGDVGPGDVGPGDAGPGAVGPGSS